MNRNSLVFDEHQHQRIRDKIADQGFDISRIDERRGGGHIYYVVYECKICSVPLRGLDINILRRNKIKCHNCKRKNT
jgi:hypothetical protein